MLQEAKWQKAHQSHEPSKLQSLCRILGLHTYHYNKLQRGPNLHQIHQNGLIRNLSIRSKPIILISSFSVLQELWEYRFGGWGVYPKGWEVAAMNQRSCLGNVMFIWHGNSPTTHVLYHLQKTLHFSATKIQTTLHACTLPIKPINAPAILSNQAYHISCKRQWLIRRKATYITFLYHEQTSISLKSGTRLPWKDTRGDLSRTYHCS